MSWKTESLHKLFNPESIAVIGASNKPDRLGALTLLSLKAFDGSIYPVNPRHSTIGDMKCYSSVTDIPDEVDLALICLGGPAVLSIVAECAKAQVRSSIIFAAGYKELGSQGEEIQKRLKEIVDKAHIAVIGPNCLGAGNVNQQLNATFFPHPQVIKKGNVSLISQSGGVTGLMLYKAIDVNLGVAKFASVGNRVNIDFHDLIQYLREDPETKSIGLFVEGTESAREMTDQIALTTPEKPVIVYKVGKTPVAREAALSHTGSLAGKPELYSAAIKQSGGLEVESIMEMVDVAKVLSTIQIIPKGNRVVVLTHTLGIALIAAQTLEENEAVLPMPSEKTIESIQGLLDLPIVVPIRNPIDLLAQGWSNPRIFADAFKLILNEPQFDAVMIVFAPNYQEDIGGGMPVTDIIDATKQTKKPVISVLSSPAVRPPSGVDQLEENGIPFFASPQRAALALAKVLKIRKL